MNGQLDLCIIAQPYSAVYWGYFRRLVFGNSLTKNIKLSSFSYSVLIFFLPISHIPPCFHANPPDFPRLIGPRGYHYCLCDAVDRRMPINKLINIACSPYNYQISSWYIALSCIYAIYMCSGITTDVRMTRFVM